MSKRTSIDALLLFYDVVNAKSINKASVQLDMPKSTISRKLHQLEEAMGSVLIKRSAEGLALTDIGRSLYDHCVRIVAEVEDAGLKAGEIQSDMRGVLRVSLPMDFWMSWIGKALADFSSDHPGLRMEIQCQDRWVDVTSEPFDVAIHVGEIHNIDLTVKRLGRLSRGLYGSPAYFSRRGLPGVPEQLQGHDWIQLRQQPGQRPLTAQAELPEIDARFVVNSIGFARELVLNGQGLGIFPNRLCTEDVAQGRLLRALPQLPLPDIVVSATFIGQRHLPRKTRAFLDFIAGHLDDA